MSNQVKKSERIKVDRGNLFDPYNNLSSGDSNRNGHKKITNEIIDYYIPCKNFSCKLDYFKKFINKDIEPPSCFINCKLNIHKTGNGDYPVVETLRKGLKDPEVIYMSRPNLLWCWYNKLPIIFRTSWENRFHIHHTTGVPLNDDPELLSVISSGLHTKLTTSCKKLDIEISKIHLEMSVNPSMSLRKILDDKENEKRRICDIQTDPEVWDLIDDLYRKASNLSEI